MRGFERLIVSLAIWLEMPVLAGIFTAQMRQDAFLTDIGVQRKQSTPKIDGHPGSMTCYFNQVADFFGLPRPPLITKAEAEQQLSPGMLSYLWESRRLSNSKMLDELQLELQYPNLAAGLPACLSDG